MTRDLLALLVQGVVMLAAAFAGVALCLACAHFLSGDVVACAVVPR